MDNNRRLLLSSLRAIKNGDIPQVDEEYRMALKTLGLADFGWDVKITPLGESVLAFLEPDTYGR